MGLWLAREVRISERLPTQGLGKTAGGGGRVLLFKGTQKKKEER